MIHRARPRHPVTGARIRLRARSARELEAYKHRIETLRTELRLQLKTPEQVSEELRYLKSGPITLERAALAYLARPIAPNTRRAVRSLMATHLRELLPVPLAALDAARVAALVDAMNASGNGGTTVATAWRQLSAIARHAAERGWIGAAPWGAYRPRLSGTPVRAPREAARTLDELAALIVAAAELDRQRAAEMRVVLLEAAITVCVLFGLRQGELAGLRWNDWTPLPASMLVARQYDGDPLKRGTPIRRLGAVDELAPILARQRTRLETLALFASDGPIFPHAASSRPGRPRAYPSGSVIATRDLRSVVAIARLPHPEAWSPHSLRDTFVTLESAATGGDLQATADRSRHATLASLARYLRALSRDPAPPAFTRQRSAAGAGLPLLGHAPPPPKEEPPT